LPDVEDLQFAATREVAERVLQDMREQTRTLRDLSDRTRLAIDDSRLAIKDAPESDTLGRS
jgi:hypothetical protein